MKFNQLYFLFVIILVLQINACTNTRIPSQANIHVDHINIQHRIDIANLLFKQHDYHASLVQWKILHSIQPENPQYKNRIRVLEALIKRRLKGHLSDANEAFDKNDITTAEQKFLTVLALDPEHSHAISMLKQIEYDRTEKKQATKTQKLLAKRQLSLIASKTTEHDNDTENNSDVDEEDKDNEQALFYLELGIDLFNKKDWRGSIREIDKYLPTNPSDKNAIKYLTTSHLNLSQVFEERGHLEPAIQHIEDIIALSNDNKKKFSEKQYHLKQKLSANYYIEGVKVYRDNIDQAINYWRRAIESDPGNEKAKIRLRKAEKMKENLNAIQPD
ncbi:MAG: hypothetical protein OEX07_06635 [Gammaproteobacteria bacterium]|nr:hypothetical protein [Gammaproteobacteria bacterium]